MEIIWRRLKAQTGSFLRYLLLFVKWAGLSILCGVPIGLIGWFFHYLVEKVTVLRETHDWILFLLPLGGALIALLYRVAGMEKDGGTNRVLRSVRQGGSLPFRMAPLIFVSTILTHLVGGSSGREGAALQLGGSLAAQAGRWFHLDRRDQHILTLCGMSAAFAALFGTPLTAAVFAMEVVTVGTMYYAAIVPCIFAGIIGAGIAGQLGAVPTAFQIAGIPELSVLTAVQVLALGALCAAVSILFCLFLHAAGDWYCKFLPDSILRAAAGGALVLLLTFVTGTRDYNGAGMAVIVRAVAGEAVPYAFLLKILFTALTLGAGFKGGEIVPAFFVGATFGCTAGGLLGLAPGFGAAVGLAGVFCGVVNCPLATLILCLELFGGEGMPLFALAVAVSYLLSGRFSLYSGQRFSYSRAGLAPAEHSDLH